MDELMWRLKSLEDCDKKHQELMEKLESELYKSIDRVYDKLDKNNLMLITSLVSSLLTLLMIIAVFMSTKM